MQRIAISVFVASAVFFALMTDFDVVFGGASLTAETLISNGFRTLIFAMAFAAIKVAMIMFKGSTK